MPNDTPQSHVLAYIHADAQDFFGFAFFFFFPNQYLGWRDERLGYKIWSTIPKREKDIKLKSQILKKKSGLQAKADFFVSHFLPGTSF